MITIDLRGKAALITGGTKGIGLAAGLEFGRAGCRVYLTHRWGSADEGEIAARFAAVGAPEPRILQADVSNDEDTRNLMNAIADEHDGLHAFISNVGFALVTDELEGFKLKNFHRTMEYSSWPLISHLKAAKKRFGRYPRYTLAVSSFGPDNFYPGYDYVAAAKAVMETMVKYLGVRLRKEGCNAAGIRLGMVCTESFRATFGERFTEAVLKHAPDKFVSLEHCGQAMLALCSGLMDGFAGHTITVDSATGFADNMITMHHDGLFRALAEVDEADGKAPEA